MIALSLFAGVGFGVACERLGITELGVELAHDVVASRDAAGMTTIDRDVRSDLLQPNGLAYDILLAGPPCQAFSLAGRGAGRRALDEVLGLIKSRAYERTEFLTTPFDDERTGLVIVPLAYIDRDRPSLVVLEQVPPVLPVWEAYAVELRLMGYSVATGIVAMEAYGVPQTRRRAVLVARNDGQVATLPTPTHSRYHVRTPSRLDLGVAPWISMADALGWEPGAVGFPRKWDGLDDGISIGDEMYRARDLRATDKPAFGLTSKARSWKRWGFVDRPALTQHGHGMYTRGPTGAKQAIVAGLEHGTFIPRPPYTIETARKEGVQREDYLSLSSRYHPDAVNVTPEEAAVLQTFPHDFPFRGSRTSRFLTIGNSVPPLFAEQTLRHLLGAPA